jgi:thiol-disulfide isomerase/thioredoxin
MRRFLSLMTLVSTIAWANAEPTTNAASLKIGSPAPKLQAAGWAQGEPVTELSKGTAYIVEFWATWCGPCRAAIPHLNELSLKYKDKGLVVIGQNCWEREESKVEPFIKTMGDKMTYRVALDIKNDAKDRGRMAETWMQAADRHGIPCSFVVDKEGKIAFIGHPMSLKEETLDQILAGTWDYAKAQAALEEENRKAAEFRQKAQEKAKPTNSPAKDG